MAYGAQLAWTAIPRRRSLITSGLVLLLVLGYCRTIMRNRDWTSRETLLRYLRCVFFHRFPQPVYIQPYSFYRISHHVWVKLIFLAKIERFPTPPISHKSNLSLARYSSIGRLGCMSARRVYVTQYWERKDGIECLRWCSNTLCCVSVDRSWKSTKLFTCISDK